MKILQATMLIFSLGMAGMAQPRNQAPVRTDLMSALLELDRTAAATNSDISHLQIEKWKGGWKTGFTTSSSHKSKAGQVAVSLQRNLGGALPDLIREAMNTRGGLDATFKVYEDVSLVVQTLDSLVEVAQQYGTRGEYEPLVGDYNSLARLRRTLSAYIHQKAALADGGSASSYSGFSAMSSVSDGQPLPRRIVVDDAVPEKKSAASDKKKKSKSTIPFNSVQ